MFMPKDPVSVTLERGNLAWLRGRAAALKRHSLSEALDALVTRARLGDAPAAPSRSVVGTIDISPDDPDLDRGDEYVRALMDASLKRPSLVRERAPRLASRARRPGPSKPRQRRG
jgi:hypothetical protein